MSGPDRKRGDEGVWRSTPTLLLPSGGRSSADHLLCALTSIVPRQGTDPLLRLVPAPLCFPLGCSLWRWKCVRQLV
jgi:hypothetical protein